MLYVGIDYHKRYSVLTVLDKAGTVLDQRRINHTHPEAFRQYLMQFKHSLSVVYESSFNWSWLYELLEAIPCVQHITLANPYKVRLIAEAQIKTDKIDSRKLAELLRVDLIPACYTPDRPTRQRKEVLRQRAYWVKQRTATRNRIHRLLDRQHGLNLPKVSDLFGKKGRLALSKAALPDPDQRLLEQNLSMLDALNAQIKAAEQIIRAQSRPDRRVQIIQSIPGQGPILASIVATETDRIERFSSCQRYTSYAGLAPTTHSSGGKTYMGRMMFQCNQWLKWAFIEAAWVAVGCSPYFGGLYRYHLSRGKKANTAITIVARRMCRIVYQLLQEDRLYERRPFTPAALAKG